MQPGLESADGRPRKILNFSQFVTLCVVQENDDTVVVAELRQRVSKPFAPLGPVPLAGRVIRTRPRPPSPGSITGSCEYS